MLRGFCGSFEPCRESEKALDWAADSASSLFTENPSLQERESRASLLGHSVVLDQSKLPILWVCLYQREKLFFLPWKQNLPVLQSNLKGKDQMGTLKPGCLHPLHWWFVPLSVLQAARPLSLASSTPNFKSRMLTLTIFNFPFNSFRQLQPDRRSRHRYESPVICAKR